MSGHHRSSHLRRRSSSSARPFPAFSRHVAKQRSSKFARVGFEPLENRWLLTVDLSLAGAQTLPGGANIDASSDHASQQQNMAIDINPTNPLHLTGVSQRNTPTTGTSLGLYRSTTGGASWITSTIDSTIDLQAAGATRFNPILAYDTAGNLYVAYGVNDGTSTKLIVATSTDDGATFSQVKTVASVADAIGSLSGFGIGTGPDGLGHQAVYVAFNETVIGVPGVFVAGSNDGGTTFTTPVLVSDTLHAFSSPDASVGPSGQLYVSWYDATDSAVRFDRDLDGLFVATNSFGSDITVVNNGTARPTLSGNFQLFFHQLVPAQPNHGISTSPVLDVDRTGNATDGTLYIAFADLFNAGANDVDLYVAQSTNQGANWSFAPVVTGGATEFMPALDVDQASGSVNVLYYSTNGDASGNDDVNVMLATSIDAGNSFINNQKLTTATSRASTILGGNDFGDYNGLAALDGTLQGMWADNRGPSLAVEAFTASASFASATDGNVLTVLGTVNADAVIIRRSAANHAFVEVLVNGQLQYAGLLATIDNIIVNTIDNSDTLTIDNSNGVVNTLITFDGGTSAGDDDRLAITGDPGTPIARETIIAGATTGSGTYVLDPDGSRGAGINAAGNGDELTINFSNLEPIDTDVPSAILDIILNTADNIGTLQDGGLLNGNNSLQLVSGNATFESVRFANKLTARIMGNSGADTLTADYTTASAALVGLELYGHVAADVLGQPADDNLSDTLKVLRNAALVAHVLHGNGGDDNFTVGNGDLSLILSPVAVFGDDGNDSLVVDDSVRTADADYYVDPTTIAICTNPGPPPVHANIALYDATLEQARLNGTQGINRFDVTPSVDTTLFIDGNEPHVVPGDLLSIRFAGTTGAQLTNVAGAGMWTFTNRKNVMFEDIERFNFLPLLVYGAEAAANGKPTVKVVDATTGALVTSFLAYESTYNKGVRVAVGDINGDGIPEIITAPGGSHIPTVKIFNILTGAEMTSMDFSAYPNAFKDGVNVAVGDVNADGLNDIVTSPSHGKSEIHTYLNQFATNPTTPFDNTHRNRFLAFDPTFIGGATVAVGDVSDDAKAEIIVGSGAGLRAEVRKFDGMTNGSVSTAAAFLQHFKPFDASQRGGVTVSVANLDADAKLEIVVGTGTGGHSQIATFDTSNLSVPLHTFLNVYTGNGSNAPIRTAAIDTDFDGLSNLFLAQGPDGRSQIIRTTPPLGPIVDFLMDNDVEFRNGFYLGADVNSTSNFRC